ncbi:MAG: ABC transporter permease [Lachnospiraceae bacterium]|nr:ABC transporter permease [Lachnospiraceae bacterium]
MILTSPDFYNAILRATTPILFATLAAGVAQQAGICNMALEGIMLFASLFGAIYSYVTGSWIAGLLLTMLSGAAIGLILAFFVLNLKTDEIIAAIAINLTAAGGTVLLLLAFSGDRGTSSFRSIPAPNVAIPGISAIPFLGRILSGRNFMTWLAIIMVIVMHLFLYKTPLGLKIRAVGENKNAAESVGISSRKIQYIALIISGVLASMGGYFLSSGYMTTFTKDMSAGRGFIALAASAMGRNTPVGGFLVALLFGIAQAVSNQLQLTSIPVELLQMIPYVITLIGLAVFSYVELRRKAKLSGK